MGRGKKLKAQQRERRRQYLAWSERSEKRLDPLVVRQLRRELEGYWDRWPHGSGSADPARNGDDEN